MQPGGSIRGWHLWLVAVLAFGVFVEALSAGFTFDDNFLVLGDRHLDGFRPSMLLNHLRRPLRDLTFAIDRSLFGLDPLGYHLHSILWHVACSLLVYLLLKKVSGHAGAALLGALVFAVHPVHVEAVANVSNRKEPLSLAFSLLALLSWLRAIDAPAGRRGRWIFASVVSLTVAWFGKEVAVAVVPVAVAYEYLLVPPERRLLLRHPRLVIAGTACLTVGVLALVFHRQDLFDVHASHTLKGFGNELTLTKVILTVPKTFWLYVQLLVWPVGLCPDHRVELSTHLLHPLTLFSWSTLLLVPVAVLRLRRREPLLAFAIAWFVLTWLPISNLLPIAYALADRYLYAPSVGLSLAVAWLAIALRDRLSSPRHQHAAIALYATLLGALAVVSFGHTRVWKGPETLWPYTVTCNPRSFLGWNGIGNLHAERGEHDQAAVYYERAGALGYGPAFHNRAEGLVERERYAEALEYYSRALELDSGLWPALLGRAHAAGMVGRHEQSISDYDQLVETGHHEVDIWIQRGAAHAALGRYEQAAADFAQAAKLDPRHALAHFNLGSMQIRMGQVENARAALQKAAMLGLEEAERALALIEESLEGRSPAQRRATSTPAPGDAPA